MTLEERDKATWEALADEARHGLRGADALVEAMRRVYEALESQTKSSGILNTTMVWLTWAMFILAAVQIILTLVKS